MQRDRCSASQAERKVAAQMPLHLKEDKSQFVLDNSGSRSHCQHQVELQDCGCQLHVNLSGIPFCMFQHNCALLYRPLHAVQS